MSIVDIEKIKKLLRKLDVPIARKVRQWVDDVEADGLREVRKVPGWHDEPVKGGKKGLRSVRLNIKWRLFYRARESGDVEVVTVEDVTPHKY